MARYDCEHDEFSGAFVELSDVWTRGEMRRFANEQTDPDAYWQLIRNKITALSLPTVDGDTIDNPDLLTDEDVLDAIDVRLWQWFSYVPIKHVGDLRKLGEALGLGLFSTSGAVTSPKATPAKLAEPTPSESDS